MTKMMQDDGVAEEDCRGFIDDLQRASRTSFRRAMLQANLLRITANFDNPVFLFRAVKNRSQFMNLIKNWQEKTD